MGLEHVPSNLDALVDREQRCLLRVDENGDDNTVEQPRAARDDVDVPFVSGSNDPG
jgi:hypothetical protein